MPLFQPVAVEIPEKTTEKGKVIPAHTEWRPRVRVGKSHLEALI